MSERILLGVNVDHVATLRQARGTRFPDPVFAAQIAEQAGADGITIHPREDRRHIQDRDVLLMKETLTTRMNLEMAVTEAMLDFAEKIMPEHCCLVPEKREELTTEGGLDVVGQESRIRDACQRLEGLGIEVSLFIDADSAQIEAAERCGASAIELHTGHYADATTEKARLQQLEVIQAGVTQALDLELIVNAGHGLHYHNVQDIAAIPGINELNIGHSIIARSIFTGLDAAVREMKAIMLEAAR